MSSIGKNIRKIRTIKGLSQSAFANLFNLTRASISAYEESRAEPKMDATLEIAKYFNIPIEALLSHEITVNEFAKFNLQDFIGGGLDKENKFIPIVSSHNWDQFLKEGTKSEFPTCSFPRQFVQGDIAIVVNEAINSNFHSGTILFCKEETSVSENGAYLVLDKERASVKNGVSIGSVKGKRLFKILQTIQELQSLNSGSVEDRLSLLEMKVHELTKK